MQVHGREYMLQWSVTWYVTKGYSVPGGGCLIPIGHFLGPGHCGKSDFGLRVT